MSVQDDFEGRDALEAMAESLDDDVLDVGAWSDDEIDAELASLGVDVEAAGARARDQVGALLEGYHSPWQRQARARRSRHVGTLSRDPRAMPQLERDELLRRVELMRRHPQFEGRVRAYFRGRQPAEASDEELRGLLEDLDDLQRLVTGDDDQDALDT